MQQLTLSIDNGKITLSGDPEFVAKILTSIKYTENEQSLTVSSSNLAEKRQESYLDFFTNELDRHIKGGRFFASELARLYHHNDNDYKPLANVYRDLVNRNQPGWTQRRQLLLTASAVWRFVFKPKPSLMYQIEAASECSDCGAFAAAMIRRLKQEGLW